MGVIEARVALVGDDAARGALLGAVAIAVADTWHAEADLLLVPARHRAAMPAIALPYLVLDAPDAPVARAALLDGGAADVVGCDADPVEIRARIRAALRRTRPLTCGDLAIDVAARRVARAGRPIALHPREFAVLEHLARNRDRAVSRDALYGAVWQRDFDPGTNVVAVAVSRLRAKVERRGERPLIHTVARGYMLSALSET